MTHLLDVYLTQIKQQVIAHFQYRADFALQLFGKFAEPVIYLVVWSTIATQNGGALAGYSVAQFAGYFIAWTLVRQMTIGWDPFWMERRIRRGDFTPLLLRPVHPFHRDTAIIMGSKVVEIFLLIPTMVILTLLFRPELELFPWAVAGFLPAVLMAFLLRYTMLYLMALTAFWTTRVTALFRIFFGAEFFLSGRIAPLATLPLWAQTIAAYLPLKWMFAFPLELLVGRLTPQEMAFGFAMQALWVSGIALALVITWRFASRHYTAVGG